MVLFGIRCQVTLSQYRGLTVTLPSHRIKYWILFWYKKVHRNMKTLKFTHKLNIVEPQLNMK